MTNEEMIHAMLDEIEEGWHTTYYKKNSKYSIIEKYFKQIREDTKRDCVAVLTAADEADYPYTREEVIEEIKKL